LAPSVPFHPAPLAALRAWLRAPRLDRELSTGTASWRSPVHAARSRQLTSNRRRRRLARSLERLIETSEQSMTSLPGPAVPPRPDQVLTAKSLLVAIASRLRSGDPVDARGVAYLRELLCNGDSPVYARSLARRRAGGRATGRLRVARRPGLTMLPDTWPISAR